MRRIVRVVALVAVIACVVCFFSTSSGAGGGFSAIGARQESWLTIGQPWPWYESRLEEEIRPDGSQAGKSESGVIPNSPAWLLLAGALAGFVAFRRLRSGTPAAALA